MNLNKKLSLNPKEITDFLKRDLPADLFTAHSLNTFSRFNISPDFLQVDSLEWQYNKNYKKTKKY